MTPGRFISVEGIDGSGKSTHARRLLDYLHTQGITARLVREPGETALGEKIRALLLDRTNQISPMAELLLYEAARAELCRTVIRPALAGGTWILADRFFDSTTAYQGYGRGIPLEAVTALNAHATDGLVPDLTLTFELPLELAMTRRGKIPDRLEAESRSFFERVRLGYQAIAMENPKRVVTIDSAPDADQVFATVRAAIRPLIEQKSRG